MTVVVGESADWEQLYTAIGRVAVQSAENDDSLREVLRELMGHSNGWILAEGQPAEWLCTTLPVMLHMEDPYNRTWPEPMHAALLAAAKELNKYREHRNTIVHSTWVKGPVEREDDTTARPWGELGDQMRWAVFRSRYRTYGAHAEWTISDIELLADKMCIAGEALMVAYARMEQHKHPSLFPESRWAAWLESDARAK